MAALAALSAESLKLGVDLAYGGSLSLMKLAEAERKRLHDLAYEKEFTVDLNMTEAHVSGKALGLQADTDTDFTPLAVAKVQKNGLLESWNRANPDREVHVGDQIMRVNDIIWHHNTKTFAKRISGQFLAAKTYKEGAKRTLSLTIQRPRQQSQTRFESQRQDLHRQQYSKEFVANISVLRNRGLGWELNTTQDWKPASVHKVDSTGLVALWNQEHPEFRIYPGDEIIQANRLVWHHNSQVFGSKIDTQLHHLAQTNSNEVLSLHIQRPRSVIEKLEDRVFVKSAGKQGAQRFANFSYARGWLAEIPARVGLNLGLKLNATDDEFPVTVTNIQKLGAVHIFNEDNPDDALVPGDQIFKVNDIMWGSDSRTFGTRLDQQFAESARTGSSGRVRLWVQRPVGVDPDTASSEDSADYMEFTAELAVPTTPSETMGWGLNTTDGGPVSVGKILAFGSVSKWNHENPMKDIEPGDQIVQVEENVWSNDTRPFMKRLGLQLKAKDKRAVTVLFRRFFNDTSDGTDDDEVVGDGDVLGSEQ